MLSLLTISIEITNSLLVSKARSSCDVCKCSWPSDGREVAAAHEVLTYEEQQQPSLFNQLAAVSAVLR